MRRLLFSLGAVLLALSPLDVRAQCYDYATPGLELILTYTVGERVNDVDVSGDLVFLAEKWYSGPVANIRILDFADPTSPREVATASYEGDGPNSLATVGDHVLVGDEVSGVVSFDVSDPSHPVEVANLSFGPFPVYEIAVSGDLSFVMTWDGLRILDVSTPGELLLLGSHPRGGKGGVVVEGDYVYHGTVDITEALGEVTLLYFRPDAPGRDAVIAKLPGIHKDVRGKDVRLTATPDKVHLFANGTSLLYR